MPGVEYEPGTVAVATVRGVPNVRVFRWTDVYGRVNRWDSAALVDEMVVHLDEDVTNVRPLVVLDLGNDAPSFLAANLKAAADKHRAKGHGSTADSLVALVDQIKAQTKPPKPVEPTGLGAVVEASCVHSSVRGLWVRDHHGNWDVGSGNPDDFASLIDVRVLSEGVVA